MICEDPVDRNNLIFKAAAALVAHGETSEIALRRVQDLEILFEELL